MRLYLLSAHISINVRTGCYHPFRVLLPQDVAKSSLSALTVVETSLHPVSSEAVALAATPVGKKFPMSLAAAVEGDDVTGRKAEYSDPPAAKAGVAAFLGSGSSAPLGPVFPSLKIKKMCFIGVLHSK